MRATYLEVRATTGRWLYAGYSAIPVLDVGSQSLSTCLLLSTLDGGRRFSLRSRRSADARWCRCS